ncbi:NAD(P)-dependent oxidoreductase [Mycobacterium kansasii]|uniref:NmrA-like family protein n=3 Tax=Mycobacterium kansasii TaxID=1768 RepID=A0A1V3X9N2_MYCKA|nr:SDR family oxidoreductase [Mycobacterium kansasii]AGZ50897.1 epimerase [Mycobacterium kansasii ATCC 12478]ARG62826.1 epimerase [Mycobacterium kansasii]ARG70442.1 epimerase [Mycobacterium kansasii]ARG77478.1 epimerase [Mycobacterium kansasii]ARG80438.1 epimerase [Mycobacterium kansasii]
MKITVFGATGGVGKHLVTQALQRGHAVNAVVRDAARLPISSPGLSVSTVPGLEEPTLLRPALRGSDAVLSAVGPRGRKDTAVAATCTRSIVRAMQATGVERLVAVSAAPVGPVPPGESLLTRAVVLPILTTVLRSVYTDLAEMEAELGRSHIAWTIVRPPKLTNKPLTGSYRTVLGGNVPRGSGISRADVAHLMLTALDQSATVRQAIGIAY